MQNSHGTPDSTAATIFLVEDDAPLRQGLTELFSREGYSVIVASCAQEAREKLAPDMQLIILDVSLLDGDGVHLCRDWRIQCVRTPILFLTARDEDIDVVRGLDAGGNDYVAKPFRMMELLSRIRVLLRTHHAAMPDMLMRGDIQVDQQQMQVRKSGELSTLLLTEYRLLLVVMRQTGIVPRGALLESLWDADCKFIDNNTLSVRMSRLREKIGAQHIKTIRGVGYQWVD